MVTCKVIDSNDFIFVVNILSEHSIFKGYKFSCESIDYEVLDILGEFEYINLFTKKLSNSKERMFTHIPFFIIKG